MIYFLLIEANLGLGYTSYILKASQDALTPLRKSLQYIDDKCAWNIYGLCLEECSNYEEAEKAFQRSGSKLNRARALLRSGRYIRESFSQLINHFSLYRYQEALDIYSKSKKLSLTNSLHYVQSLLLLNQFDKAIQICSDLLKTNRDERILITAACIEYQAGRNESAKKYLEEWFVKFCFIILTNIVSKNSRIQYLHVIHMQQ